MKLIINQDCDYIEISQYDILALALKDSNQDNLKQSL